MGTPACCRKKVVSKAKAGSESAKSTHVAHESTAAEVLNHPDDASNLSAAEVDTGKAVPVRSAGADGLLKLVGVDHHGDGVVLIARKQVRQLRRNPVALNGHELTISSGVAPVNKRETVWRALATSPRRTCLHAR